MNENSGGKCPGYLNSSFLTVPVSLLEIISNNLTGGPIHESLVLILYVQNLPSNAHTDIFSRPRGFNFGLFLHLHSYFVYASS